MLDKKEDRTEGQNNMYIYGSYAFLERPTRTGI